ncbi:hypothetical protein AMELA_G00059870 [Ameiurus melas]|uniref:Uncharacterized protein n=1 Tax=Ameiurus melas TaxID=219545 RepID=A0A7J6B3D2_AMEME|nr:hypothetical protein AMELA_G00059870 [Ameiurus melas]
MSRALSSMGKGNDTEQNPNLVFLGVDLSQSWKGREAEQTLGQRAHIPHRSPAKETSVNEEKQAEEVSLN